MALIKLSNGAWVVPECVGAIFDNEDDEEVTVCSHTGQTMFTDSFDSAVKARIFCDEAAKQINAALEKPVDHLK